MTESDTDLIRRAQADDIDAFCLLAQRYARRIHLLAFHYCRNAQDAEDLSQEVWLKAYQALRSFRSDSSFYTWLRRITINAFLNHRRASFFRRRGQTTAVQLVQIDSEPLETRSVSPENIYNKLLFESVVEALAELTPSQRLAFLLRHYEGMSYDEIANAMNCSSGTVKKGVSRAIVKLRARLSPPPDASEESLTNFASEY
ncbi:MAG TPA: sigma-70 family RNA polymerase sigma factor [Pyrinomonadaceae bacterium]|nr:sigma-70 family RNA polymerase sigma factor [Pyrinomonadaceae bacterium]